MRVITEEEAVQQFKEACEAAGLIFDGKHPRPIMDGQVHYVRVDGNKRGDKSGLYRGYLSGRRPAGYIRNYKTGYAKPWKADAPTKRMSPEEQAAWERTRAEQEAVRQAEQRRAHAVKSALATSMWNKARPVATHPYLTKKKVWSHGLRQSSTGGLLVPMHDVRGKIWSLQTIYPDLKTKRYLKGGDKTGHFFLLGQVTEADPIISIGEGFATAATWREATATPTAVAFDSSNLVAVAQALHEAYPDKLIVMVADNDHQLPFRDPPLPNAGMVKAKEAAELVGGVVVAPTWSDSEEDKRRSDWNDVAEIKGVQEVRRLAAEALAPHGIILGEWKRPMVTQAARDAARQQMRHHRQASSPGPGAAGREAPGPQAQAGPDLPGP